MTCLNQRVCTTVLAIEFVVERSSQFWEKLGALNVLITGITLRNNSVEGTSRV